jgi:hypothetical protein
MTAVSLEEPGSAGEKDARMQNLLANHKVKPSS